MCDCFSSSRCFFFLFSAFQSVFAFLNFLWLGWFIMRIKRLQLVSKNTAPSAWILWIFLINFVVYYNLCWKSNFRPALCKRYTESDCNVYVQLYCPDVHAMTSTDIDILTYSRDELLALRSTASTIPRSVRSKLFIHNLWLPAYKRFKCDSSHESSNSYAIEECKQVHGQLSDITDGSCVSDVRATGGKGRDLCIGYLNCQSIGNKSASLSNIIDEQNLDAFAVVETFHESSDDITLKQITPDGFICLDQAREMKRSVRSETQKKTSSGAGAGRPLGGAELHGSARNLVKPAGWIWTSKLSLLNLFLWC